MMIIMAYDGRGSRRRRASPIYSPYQVKEGYYRMSARRVFYSFYFKHDVSRAATVREIGTVVGNLQESDDRWAVVQKGGDEAIQEWIDEQMADISCLVVLIGQSTAGRRWVRYEISKAWELGIGIIGVHIHRLADAQGRQSTKGSNPFELIVINDMVLAATVRTYDPPAATSEGAYRYIARHLKSWVEEAITDGRSGNFARQGVIEGNHTR